MLHRVLELRFHLKIFNRSDQKNKMIVTLFELSWYKIIFIIYLGILAFYFIGQVECLRRKSLFGNRYKIVPMFVFYTYCNLHCRLNLLIFTNPWTHLHFIFSQLENYCQNEKYKESLIIYDIEIKVNYEINLWYSTNHIYLYSVKTSKYYLSINTTPRYAQNNSLWFSLIYLDIFDFRSYRDYTYVFLLKVY